MKSGALKELIGKIFSDNNLKAEFVRNPDSVICNYKLTDSERQAVLNAHAKLGLVGSDSQQLTIALSSLDNWYAPLP